jgi:flagellar biosynthesis protein FliR
MPLSLAGIYGLLPAYLLVLCRIGGLLLTAPVFSSIALPVQIRVLLAAAVSLAVFPTTLPLLPSHITLAAGLAGLLGELAIGVFLGMAVGLVFMGLELAAEVVSQQSGMKLAEVFNPMLESTSGALGELYVLLALIVFIALRGDHALIRSLLDSFRTVPPMGFRVSEGLLSLVLDLLLLSFSIAIRVGGPIILALMLSFLTLGFLNRTMPQMHLLTIGFPLKIAICVAVAAMCLMGTEGVLTDGLQQAFDAIRAGLGLEPGA